MGKDGLTTSQWQEYPQKKRWQSKVRTLGSSFLGSLSPRFEAPTQEDTIAYLDGLRGFAAFMVYCVHHFAFAHEYERRTQHSWGSRGEYLFAALPVVRFLFAGGAFAVAIFFVVSGYALSVSLLSLINSQRPDALRLALQVGCSFPRRWIRLYLPVIVLTLAWMASWHLFGIESSSPANQGGPSATYVEQFMRWFNEFSTGSFVFAQSVDFGQSEYSQHMWSIAVEYRGSVIIYALTIAYFALGYGLNARFWACLGIFTYFQYLDNAPQYALFVAGMLLCDLDIVSEQDPDQLPRILRLPKIRQLRQQRWIYYILLAVGVYLGGAPMLAEANSLLIETGWATLSYLVPSTSTNARWFFCVYGAVITVFCIPHIPWLKRMFETALLQHLGKISFGFYLVHGPVMWLVGDRAVAFFGNARHTAEDEIPNWIDIFPLADSGPVGLEINFLVPHLIILPLTLWLAGVVTKAVDIPTIKLSKGLFQQRKEAPKAGVAGGEMASMLPQYTDQPAR